MVKLACLPAGASGVAGILPKHHNAAVNTNSIYPRLVNQVAKITVGLLCAKPLVRAPLANLFQAENTGPSQCKVSGFCPGLLTYLLPMKTCSHPTRNKAEPPTKQYPREKQQVYDQLAPTERNIFHYVGEGVCQQAPGIGSDAQVDPRLE